eukprot:CAMPEP_0173169992 /NCGR_PEP_ID=MMETSP1141-20130122/1001_1 /TAXON_ID=483371 /ORGANISM="non described non described, Strain CCMP2298" /LENGTH=94 /DNA_ID=CAMNT_0014091859 /DNA_START=304 /DNA_END=588 /DNA_ORIENTATION=+
MSSSTSWKYESSRPSTDTTVSPTASAASISTPPSHSMRSFQLHFLGTAPSAPCACVPCVPWAELVLLSSASSSDPAPSEPVLSAALLTLWYNIL